MDEKVAAPTPLTPPELAALAELERKATPGEWILWDGCSWRRIGIKGTTSTVICPTNHPIDRHPDLDAAEEDLTIAVSARNALPRLLATIEARERELIRLGDEKPLVLMGDGSAETPFTLARVTQLRAQLASVQSSADETAAALWKAQAECESLREKADALAALDNWMQGARERPRSTVMVFLDFSAAGNGRGDRWWAGLGEGDDAPNADGGSLVDAILSALSAAKAKEDSRG